MEVAVQASAEETTERAPRRETGQLKVTATQAEQVQEVLGVPLGRQ